ncbi:putative holin-like toxin [Lactococcus hircilactis]|uniref:putative holin-like toxin n=1 Tax=Lactococcus hircilactis TaxID=1494462 RepID=UPI00248370E9|nr:putative holin-like toxin [Lactococcus hircilactis]
MPSRERKAKNLSVYQALSLMIAFAMLVLVLNDKNNKKWPSTFSETDDYSLSIKFGYRSCLSSSRSSNSLNFSPFSK